MGSFYRANNVTLRQKYKSGNDQHKFQPLIGRGKDTFGLEKRDKHYLQNVFKPRRGESSMPINSWLKRKDEATVEKVKFGTNGYGLRLAYCNGRNG